MLVTGASGGVGRSLIAAAAAQNWGVLAAVRSPSRAAQIEALELPNVRVVHGDLGSAVERAGLLTQVNEALDGAPLDAFVSCAGMIPSGPVETLPARVFMATLEANIIANLDLVRSLIGPLERAKGKVALVTALSANFALFPLMGAYAASKRGMNSLAMGLRAELAPLGISVSALIPGGIKTKIFDYLPGVIGTLRQDARGEDVVERYAPFVQQLSDMLAKFESSALEPDVVARIILDVLASDAPLARYVIGKDAKTTNALHGLLPDRLFARMMAAMSVPKAA